MIEWRATFVDKTNPHRQITIEFDAPKYNNKFNYKLLAKLAFVKKLTFNEQIKVTNVEPIERR
jgi:hypothetical protein